MATLEGERASLRAKLSDLDAEREKLQQELTNLAVERDRVEFALAVLDRIDTTPPTPRAPVYVPRPAMRPARRRIGATTEYMLKALDTIGHPSEVDALIPAMREHGWAAQPVNEVETVRQSLLRAVRDEMVVRVGAGLYGLPEWISPGFPKGGDDAEPEGASGGDTDEVPDPGTGEPEYDDPLPAPVDF